MRVYIVYRCVGTFREVYAIFSQKELAELFMAENSYEGESVDDEHYEYEPRCYDVVCNTGGR